MDVREAVSSRYSCRAFLDKPVPEETIREILDQASHAPSGGNLQPWHVHAVAGGELQRLKDEVMPRTLATPRGDGAEYRVYPDDLVEPYKARRFTVGELLYRSIGVPREDKAGRYRQFSRNGEFFGAPVALFVTTHRQMGAPQWSDLGMFIQTLSLIARAEGLHTCAQEYWTAWHKTVGAFLALPPEQMLFCGIAIGYEDASAPINQWRSPRAPVAEFATFRGF
jgi:nitroreductase